MRAVVLSVDCYASLRPAFPPDVNVVTYGGAAGGQRAVTATRPERRDAGSVRSDPRLRPDRAPVAHVGAQEQDLGRRLLQQPAQI